MPAVSTEERTARESDWLQGRPHHATPRWRAKPSKPWGQHHHQECQGCGPAAASLAAICRSGDGCKGAQHHPSRVTPGSAVDERAHLPLCSGLRISMFDLLLGFTARGVGDEHGRIGCSVLDAPRSCVCVKWQKGGGLKGKREKGKEPRRMTMGCADRMASLAPSSRQLTMGACGEMVVASNCPTQYIVNLLHRECPRASSRWTAVGPRIRSLGFLGLPKPARLAASPGFDTAQQHHWHVADDKTGLFPVSGEWWDLVRDGFPPLGPFVVSTCKPPSASITATSSNTVLRNRPADQPDSIAPGRSADVGRYLPNSMIG